MKHIQNAVRFAIVVFWLAAVGLASTAVSNIGGAHAIGWPTALAYLAFALAVLYAGFFLTKRFWRLSK